MCVPFFVYEPIFACTKIYVYKRLLCSHVLRMENVLSKVQDEFSVTLANPRLVDVSEERQKIYSLFGEWTQAVIGSDGDKVREFIFSQQPDNGPVLLATCSCQITYDELPLSECVEYQFEECGSDCWHLGQISMEAIEDFKAKKFALWEHQLREPECEAAFRRILQTGPIRNVYDKYIFPTPPVFIEKYKVVDEHSGKSVDLPHEVCAMRIWDPSTSQYKPFDARLAGAPTDKSSAETYWNRFITELKILRGTEYIESLLEGK